jgi:hypothetical protein
MTRAAKTSTTALSTPSDAKLVESTLPMSQRAIEKVLDIPAKPPKMIMSAAHTLLMAIPVRSSPKAEIGLRLENPPSTNITTANAPAKAPIQVAGIPQNICHPAAMTATAPREAPAEIPRV